MDTWKIKKFTIAHLTPPNNPEGEGSGNRTYGLNFDMTNNIRLTAMANPSKTPIVADSCGNDYDANSPASEQFFKFFRLGLSAPWPDGVIHRRHHGVANILFADGSVRTCNASDLDDLCIDGSGATGSYQSLE